LVDFRNGGAFTLGFGSGKFYPYFGDTDWGTDSEETPLPTDQWVHVAFVYDGTDCRMYADGVLVRTVNDPSRTQGNCVATVGSRYSGDTEFFNRYIDDLRITKGVARYMCALAPEYGTVFRPDWLTATNRKIGCRYGTYAERKTGIGF
jgi:hypothetical protein